VSEPGNADAVERDITRLHCAVGSRSGMHSVRSSGRIGPGAPILAIRSSIVAIARSYGGFAPTPVARRSRAF
jgi:hypothetical protein